MWRTAKFVLVLSLLGLMVGHNSCDKLVYSELELEVQKRYMSVPIGSTESELIKKLGMPHGKVLYDKSGDVYQLFRGESVKPVTTFNRYKMDITTEFPEIAHLPMTKTSDRIIIYTENLVHGYFYIDGSGHVVDKAVIIS